MAAGRIDSRLYRPHVTLIGQDVGGAVVREIDAAVDGFDVAGQVQWWLRPRPVVVEVAHVPVPDTPKN
ncbi:hypothetical protein GCM10011588_25330 [Nocardia jinanensis]|uniref:2'-5' RNA ligase family protein n=1 Tax=Nocardia jinanensis TaxID=382504 RepID=A0A917RIL7_9NOCA|nr:hypothetical protein GCM10011588_25330 [Nocardia jinanensis]